MPAKPQWFLRIPGILAQLSTLEAPILDRAAVERLFGLKRRQAVNLLNRFGGYQAGKALLIDRAQIIVCLKQICETGDFVYEERRRCRVGEALDRAAAYHAAARIQIRVDRQVLRRKIADLSEGIELQPGLLLVRFAGSEELLRKMYELSQAVSNDFERFCSVVDGLDGTVGAGTSAPER